MLALKSIVSFVLKALPEISADAHIFEDIRGFLFMKAFIARDICSVCVSICNYSYKFNKPNICLPRMNSVKSFGGYSERGGE